jgi:hypothetical protein
MRNLFPGYYRPTEEEFSVLWRECVFAFDANVLLNVYRYSQATSEKFLEILGRLRDRIWLPHQAALEYQENRLGVISNQHKPYEDIPKRLNALLVQMRNDYPRHPFIPIQRVFDHMNSAIGEISAMLREAREGHHDLIENDELRESLDNLFAEKVGAEYTPDELKKIYSDAQERFEKQIPPGYEDNKSKKDGDNRYGDVILWYQLKDHARALKKPLVLITDDKKADWWQKHKGKTIGPRRELIHEMKSEVGIQFYMYQSDSFMKYAQEHLGIKGGQAVEEVREVRQQYETEILKEETIASVKRQAVPDIGPRTARSWVWTVINPLLQALKFEQELLERKCWTWQFMPGRLESIRDVRHMILAAYVPNLEQFVTYYPIIRENIDIHDGEAAQLSVSCMNLQKALLDRPGLKETFKRVTSDEALSALGKNLGDMFTSDNDSECLGWIAQEIINGTYKLPSHINHSPLWNKYQNEFLALREIPEISYNFSLANRAGEKLLQTVQHLVALLREVRDQLAQAYDVPLIPS